MPILGKMIYQSIPIDLRLQGYWALYKLFSTSERLFWDPYRLKLIVFSPKIGLLQPLVMFLLCCSSLAAPKTASRKQIECNQTRLNSRLVAGFQTSWLQHKYITGSNRWKREHLSQLVAVVDTVVRDHHPCESFRRVRRVVLVEADRGVGGAGPDSDAHPDLLHARRANPISNRAIMQMRKIILWSKYVKLDFCFTTAAAALRA